MAENATIARPYARAAFEYARQKNALASWSHWLAVAASVAQSPKAAALLGNPRVNAGDLVELIAAVAKDSGASVDDDGRNFLAVLAENRRLSSLPEIALQYDVLRAEVENTLDVAVVTAMALTDAQRTSLQTALATRFGRQIRVAETVDATLLGGAIVRAGDLIIDGSLAGSLARLEQQISQS
jgi:F-type H+-transporting ATPase subunit delta